MVVGLKKFVQSIRKKKKKSTQFTEEIDKLAIRAETEVPRPIHLDLINECIPLVEGFVKSYAAQLGSKHHFTTECQAHLQKLKDKANDRVLNLSDMPSLDEEVAAANAMAIK